MFQSKMVLPSSGLNCAGEDLRNGFDYVVCMKGRWTVRPVGKGEGGAQSGPVGTVKREKPFAGLQYFGALQCFTTCGIPSKYT